MSRLLPRVHASWDEADEAFQSFVDAFPERRVQLRERLEATGGPELDGTAASLDALNEWFIRIAFEDQDDGMDWWPTWKEPYDPQRIAEALVPVSPPHLLRLWELVAIYLADLCLAETEDARWVCWRGDMRHDANNAFPLIDQGFKRPPAIPLAWATRTYYARTSTEASKKGRHMPQIPSD
jgi:hypothetical protein